jgi:ATP-dependent exoDNAse (exonuclease V) beta subunit
MRTLATDEALGFYLQRANYYDAVSFDDSVFRAYEALRQNPKQVEAFDLVLVDEFQDFNRLEAEFIRLLAEQSPIVIAGDDDQALYASLRSSSPQFIRELFASDAFDHFALPYCMRCTEVVVGAVNDIVAAAVRRGHLSGRIEKPYLFYPPKKGADSEKYPLIKVVETSVQRNGTANYFGRYVAEQIARIPREEVDGQLPLLSAPDNTLARFKSASKDGVSA